MNAKTDEQMLADMLAQPAAGQRSRRARPRWPWLALAATVLLAALAWLLAPVLLWAYDIERAGALIDRGMAWPDPRRPDSLPQARDAAALEQALAYLDDAITRRPEHEHAYRLAGQVYAARGEWARAATAFERAAALAPANPLPRWEASLAYAQMQRAVDQAPRAPLMDAFAGGQLRAPGQLVKSLFCNESGAASCYFGRASYSLPYAAYPSAPPVKRPVLFLHPTASLSAPVAIRAGQTALRFMVGLDPVARDWRTDGATFRVWVEPAGGAAVLVRELALDRAAAQRGWVLGWADLSPWAGQTVTLAIETSAEPSGDPSDDWYGWADLSLTTPGAARDAMLLPQLHAQDLRRGIR
jgi:tetratricopeptide (TPR) repeat protein